MVQPTAIPRINIQRLSWKRLCLANSLNPVRLVKCPAHDAMMMPQVPSLMNWPVLDRELLRVGRKPWLHLLRYSVAAFLILQLILLLPASRFHSQVLWEAPMAAPPILEIRRQELVVWTAFWERYLFLLLQELFWWIVLLTPAVTAGALGHEKERGTLLALFCTRLRSSEIVIGKLLGRLLLVVLPALAALPFLVLATTLGELSPVGVFLALILLLVLMLALAAASMLTAVWARRSSDAILACYASLILILIGSVTFLPGMRLDAWLNPARLLEQIVTGSGDWLLVFLGQVSAVGCVGGICLALTIWRLRPACLRQQEKRSKPWLWAYRRPIGGDPIAWRERHVIGLAPLRWLHAVPTWMGVAGVLCFSAIVAGDAANFSTANSFFPHLQRGSLVGAYQALQHSMPDRVHSHLFIMGVVLVAGSAITVGVRCGNCISEEKRRKTWEDLILTPLTRAEIIAGKRRGILAATVPALIAYALPMFGLGALAGSAGVINAAIWVIIAVLAMLTAAFIGTTRADADQGISSQAAARIRKTLIAYALPMFGLAALTASAELYGTAICLIVAGLALIAAGFIIAAVVNCNSALSLEGAVWIQHQQMIFSAAVKPELKNAPANSEWLLAVRHAALPVYSDAAGVLLFRPDGQVLDVAWGAGDVARPADSYRWLLACVAAAKRYPELRIPLPSRPKHTDNCPKCSGWGHIHTLEFPAELLCRTCNGLG
jgi:ABC-type transport system involved in multi-copper enzyme maturation permease subunit